MAGDSQGGSVSQKDNSFLSEEMGDATGQFTEKDAHLGIYVNFSIP